MAEEDEKLTPAAAATPRPVAVSGTIAEPTAPPPPPLPEKRRKSRARAARPEAEAMAEWEASLGFTTDGTAEDGEAPPAPDSTDLVLDVSDENGGENGDDVRAGDDRRAFADEPGSDPAAYSTVLLGAFEVAAAAGAVADDLDIAIDEFEASPRAVSGGFAGELPSEPVTYAIDPDSLGFAPTASDFRPHAIALGVLPQTAPPSEEAVREDAQQRLQFFAGELALLNEAASAPEEIARAAMAAARAAEAAPGADATVFYQQALAALSQSAAGLREQFRIAWQAGRVEEALGAAAGLAAALPADRAAYEALISQARAGAGGLPVSTAAIDGRGHTVRDADILAIRLRALEAALRDESPAAVLKPAEELATSLGGEAAVVLRAFAAAVRQAEGEGLSDGPAAAAGSFGALANLRRALAAPSGQALDLVIAAAEQLPSSPLTPALWLWAARLARRLGDAKRGQTLLERARALGAVFIPAQEGVDLGSDDLDPANLPIEADLLARLEGVPPELGGVLVDRLVRLLLEAGRTSDALSLIQQALQRDPAGAIGLAPLLSRIIGQRSHLDERTAREARGLLGALDPARRAELRLLATLEAAQAPEGVGKTVALDELSERLRGEPDGALQWWLAWQRRLSDRRASTAALLTAADAYAETLPGLAVALRSRASTLDAAADVPGFLASLPVARFSAPSPDDPATLARGLIEPGREVRAVAAAFTAAAEAAAIPARRYEAAGWHVQAGAFADALKVLRAGGEPLRRDPIGERFLHRLARLGDDPTAAAALLRELGEASNDLRLKTRYEHLGAELLERQGLRAEAAALYLELLASPLAKDADMGLRRSLLSLRDGAGLLNFWRDEFDARSGAGRDKAAAAAALEKARVVLDISDDPTVAAAEIAAALALDPDNRAALVLALCHIPGLGGAAARLDILERLVRDMGGSATAAGFFAALVADGEGASGISVRVLAAALAATKGQAPLALMRRYVAALESEGGRHPDVPGVLASMAERIAETGGTDRRLATTLYLRAAELAEEAVQLHRAEEFTERARTLIPDDLPSLVRLVRLQTERGDFTRAHRHLEALAAALKDPGRKAAALYSAAVMASDQVGDQNRARNLLARVLELDPRHNDAFARYRKVLEAAGDANTLANLLGRRVQVASDEEAVALRLERAALLMGKLGDRHGAKRELGNVLAQDPQNLVALGALSALELEDGSTAAAAELALRQSRIETDPGRLRDCLVRLGRIYRGSGSDLGPAIDVYERALKLDEDNRDVLDALSDLYAGKGEARKGILVTDRLLERETDPGRRRILLLRLGLLWEAAGDVRRAGMSLRHAAEQAPRDIKVLGELARFHERHEDHTARKLLLDGTIGLLLNDFRSGRGELEALRTLVPLLQWQKRPAAALCAAQLVGRLSPDVGERAEAAALVLSISAGRKPIALSELSEDERAVPHDLPPGLHHVLRVLGPAVVRMGKPDLRRFDVGREHRQGRGSIVREPFDTLAAAIGVRDFEVYVTRSMPHALAVEPGEQPAFILGAGIAALGPAALKFAAGYCARLAHTHFSLLLREGPIEAAALVASIVRQFHPEHRPPYLPEATLKASDSRVNRAITRAMRPQLAPLAAQLAMGSSPDELFTSSLELGARAGLIACGDLMAALDVLAAFAGRSDAPLATLMELPLIAHLIDFALSEDHDAVVSTLEAGPVRLS